MDMDLFADLPQSELEAEGALIFMVKGSLADASHAAECARPLLAGLAPRIQPASTIHATILLVPQPRSGRAQAVAEQIADTIHSTSFQISFDRLTWFPSQSPAAGGVAAFTTSTTVSQWTPFRRHFLEAPRRLGGSADGGASPHLTMAYRCIPFETLSFEEPVSWPVREFQLVRSLPGRDHKVIGQWSLR